MRWEDGLFVNLFEGKYMTTVDFLIMNYVTCQGIHSDTQSSQTVLLNFFKILNLSESKSVIPGSKIQTSGALSTLKLILRNPHCSKYVHFVHIHSEFLQFIDLCFCFQCFSSSQIGALRGIPRLVSSGTPTTTLMPGAASQLGG